MLGKIPSKKETLEDEVQLETIQFQNWSDTGTR